MSSNTESNLSASSKIFDIVSFETMFKEYYAPLSRSVYKIIKDADAAEDLVQDIFIKLWNKRETLQINISLKAYLYRAAMNASLNYLEAHKKVTSLNSDNLFFMEPTENHVEENLNQQELKAMVEKAIDTLPPACKTVFILSREEELSYKEIAETLQISVKTVENQMGKALKILRSELGPYISSFTILYYLFLDR